MADNFNGVMDALLKGMDSVLSTKTVVGDITKVGDAIILPLVDVTFGVGAGAFTAEKTNKGGGGISGKMTPSAVLVIQNGTTRLVNIKHQDSVTKILDMVPELVDRFTTKAPSTDLSDEDAVDLAFTQENDG